MNLKLRIPVSGLFCLCAAHSQCPSVSPEADIPSSIGFSYFNIIDFSLFGGAESFSEGKRSPRRTFPRDGDTDTSVYPAPPQDPTDFLWLMTEEPHRSRRMAIMKAHPGVCAIMIYANSLPSFPPCFSGDKTHGI